jgi:hypothetical protein
MASVTAVIYAGYGVWDSTYTVTNTAQGELTDAFNQGSDSVKFIASNDAWGGDPSKGNRKYFFIVWQPPNGPIASGVVGEGDSQGVVVPTTS